MSEVLVRERPILFSGAMIRAILEGRKSQTRRVVKPQPTHRIVEPRVGLTIGMDPADDGAIWYDADGIHPGRPIRCPYGHIGDRLWVRHPADVFPVYYKAIPDWEDRYAAGTDGRIYRIDRAEPEPLAGTPSSRGYLTVSLSRGGWTTHAVHRLVCETFYGPPPFGGAQARHLDGDQKNNRPDNLDWGTQSQNWQDRKAHGGGMGETHHSAKLTTEQVAEIRASSLPQRTLARQHGVSQSTIGAARKGDTWGEHEAAPRNLPAFRLWKSPIHMPRWASRITLELTDVRVERVQEITEEDARAEGAPMYVVGHGPITAAALAAEPGYFSDRLYRNGFEDLWDSINARRGYGWDANPWVWCLTFRLAEAHV